MTNFQLKAVIVKYLWSSSNPVKNQAHHQ